MTRKNLPILRIVRPSHLLVVILVLSMLLTGCTAGVNTQALISITIQADGSTTGIDVAPGTTVQAAIQQAGLTLGNLDRVNPPAFTALTAPTSIVITRVREEYEVETGVIAFERQTVRNETLPEGQTLLIQPGINGEQQITYRRVFEDGVEVSRTISQVVTIREAQPEIMMVGVQTPFTAVELPGTLAYLTAGNAWVMEGATGSRRPVVTTGDLDGYVFTLSENGNWLLYTRSSAPGGEDINTLWAVDLTAATPAPINLRVSNVVNFADWVPGTTNTLVYSTVEPRSTAPGWQANNDLFILSYTNQGVILRNESIIAANTGGIYGWWGTSYAWSPDGEWLAYARPDGIGLVNFDDNTLTPLLDIIPLQTRGDWAWVPGLGWAPDESILYTVVHAPQAGLATDEASPIFNLNALTTDGSLQMTLVPQCGMFAYPSPSPYQSNDRYWVAYLQAIQPDQFENTRYRLVLMDRDGSNQQIVFPPEGSPGLDPQKVVWGADAYGQKMLMGFIYQGNLWLLDPTTGQALQITGDGSLQKLDWK